MADDWAPGDLALCVNTERPGPLAPSGFQIRVGGVYRVHKVAFSGHAAQRGDDPVVLALEEDPNRHCWGWVRRHFRKINPLTEAEEREARFEAHQDQRAPASV